MSNGYDPGSTNPFAQHNSPRIETLRTGFGPRLAAYIIDFLLSGLFGVALAFIFMQFGVSSFPGMQEDLAAIKEIYDFFGVGAELTDFVAELIPAMTLGSIIAAISYTLIEGLTGASIGKMILSIKVARPDGRAGDTKLFLGRWAIKNISSLIQFVALVPSLAFIDFIGGLLGFVIFIGCFFVLGQDHLALHDRIAQTAVFHRDDIQG